MSLDSAIGPSDRRAGWDTWRRDHSRNRASYRCTDDIYRDRGDSGSPSNTTIPLAGSKSRTDNFNSTTESRPPSDVRQHGEIVEDPRLKLLRNTSMPYLTSAPGCSEGPIITPPISSVNLDGASDEETTPAHSRQRLILRDLSKTEAPPVADGTGSVLVQSLLKFMEPAVASGIQQERLKLAKNELKKAREEKQRATKQKNPPPAFIEGLNLKHDHAAKSYLIVSKLFQEIQATRTSSANDLVNQVISLIIDMIGQQSMEIRAKEACESDSFRKGMAAKVDSLVEGLKSLRAPKDDPDKTMAFEKKQRELESLIKSAQPKYEDNIDLLKKKSKEQQIDVSRLQKDNSLLKGEVQDLRERMKEMKDLITSQLSKHVLRSEFDVHKMSISPKQSGETEGLIQEMKNETEIKSLVAQLTALKQTINAKFSLYLLRDEFNLLTANSNKPTNDLPVSKGSSTVSPEVQKIKDEILSVNQKIADFATARQSALEAITRSEELGLQLDRCQKEIADLKTSKQSVFDTGSLPRGAAGVPSVPTSQKITAMEKEMTNLDNSVRSIEKNLRQSEGNFRGLQSLVYRHQNETAMKRDLVNLSTKVDELQDPPRSPQTQEAPSVLSAKERMLLSALESMPKRLNNLENSVFEIVKMEGHTPIQTPAGMATESTKKLEDKVNDLNAELSQVKDEIVQKVQDWQENLDQVRKFSENSIANLSQSLETTKTSVNSIEHSLKSLSSRYNNLTSEKMARQIAEIVQPLPMQLQQEQAGMKAALGELAAKLNNLGQSVEKLSATAGKEPSTEDGIEKSREVFAELKEFNELQQSVLNVATRLLTLESMPKMSFSDEDASKKVTALYSQFEKGRDGLQRVQEDLSKRMAKLEGRAAHASEWDNDDDDDDNDDDDNDDDDNDDDDELNEEKTRRENSTLFKLFVKPRWNSRPSSARAARGSPAIDGSPQPMKESIAFASRASMDPSQSNEIPRRLRANRMESPVLLASPNDSPTVGDQGTVPQKRPRTSSEGGTEREGNTVVVQPSEDVERRKTKMKKAL